MVRAALPQLRNTPVGKRLETKINQIDGLGDGSNTEGEEDHHPFHPSASASSSPSASEVLSCEDTSLTEDTGVTSSDADLYSPESRPKSVTGKFGRGSIEGNGKKTQRQGTRENEELEHLLQ